MIGRKAEIILNRAVRYAVDHDHEYFTLEHVLWSLMNDPAIVEILSACGGNAAEIRLELEAYLDQEVPKAPEGRQAGRDEDENGSEAGERPESGERFPEDREPPENGEALLDHPIATMGIQRLIQRALFHVQSAGKDEIQPQDLLIAMFQAKDSQALYLLSKQGIDRLDVLNYVSHGVRKDAPSSEYDGHEDEERDEHDLIPGAPGRGTGAGEKQKPSAPASDDPLQQFASNLNERARAGKIDPLVGRHIELERIIQTLCRRRKNNPLLVGEAGVGKTALAEGLAQRIVEGDVPDMLKDAVIYGLDLGSLLAGAKFRGDFEGRLKKVLSALEAKKERGMKPILLIDEIHTIIGAGAVSGSALDAANLLKPLLAQGEIRCIGSTTYTEYRNVFEKDHALARRFQKIDVPEPTQDETIQILNGLKSRFEEHHNVRYLPSAIQSAVELSAKHLTDRFLPDKAIDVIDEAGAKARLEAGARMKETAAVLPPPPTELEAPAIEAVVAQIARIPAKSVSVSQKSRLKNLERDLRFTIYGQGPAIDALVTAIRLARSGLRTGDRPVGCFLFCGPTGVGKTELSKQLAHCMGVPFLRFDMSEYSEKHTISRLIGAPPGYVGFEQAGLLTDAALKNPHSIVLLDEIEKAHSDIWNILLQVMDHGVLTDNNGRKADFRNVILIMTSNVGSRDIERRPLGVGSPESNAGMQTGAAAKKAVEQTFSPEFRNRLDAIVYFNPLDPITVGQVVGKQLLELESQLLAKGVDIDVSADVREWLAQKGYDRTMGARPLARLIQDSVKKPLAEEILFGSLENGGSVRVLMKDGQVSFEFKSKGEGAQKAEVQELESVRVSPETHREK